MLIKIDVEGFEINVLKGAKSLIDNGFVKIIIMEFHNNAELSSYLLSEKFPHEQISFELYNWPNNRITLDKRELASAPSGDLILKRLH